jgi:DNA-directed RNA polymerase subunit RPC12/RpoP
MSDGFTSFLCRHCQTEIEASPDMIGEETECPACGGRLVIPDNRDDGVTRHTADDDDDRASMQAMKSRTIRIDLGDL